MNSHSAEGVGGVRRVVRLWLTGCMPTVRGRRYKGRQGEREGRVLARYSQGFFGDVGDSVKWGSMHMFRRQHLFSPSYCLPSSMRGYRPPSLHLWVPGAFTPFNPKSLPDHKVSGGG